MYKIAFCEFTLDEVRVSSVLPSDLIEVSAMLESPQSPVVQGDHGKVKVESDLSSSEEFESIASTSHAIPSSETSNEKLQHGPNTLDIKQGNRGMPTPGEEPECKIQSSKRPRLVPKQYQFEEEVGMRLSRLPEVKESHRLERRHPTPRSPSPHGHRRYHHSPYSEKRRYQRDRPSSPGIGTLRQLSHSPPGYPVSPPHRHYSTSPPFPRYGMN